MQIANKAMKRYVTSLAIRKVQNKSIYCHTLSRMAKIKKKKKEQHKMVQEREETGSLIHC